MYFVVKEFSQSGNWKLMSRGIADIVDAGDWLDHCKFMEKDNSHVFFIVNRETPNVDDRAD